MPHLEIALPDQAATEALAARLTPLLRAGDAILLSGDLGAGKSTFARALLRNLTGDPGLEVPSPTYTLQQTYSTPAGAVHHFDLWRLGGVGELTELGWEEALNDIILVEWPERLSDHTPPDALSIRFSITGDASRLALLSGWPDRMERLA